MSHMLRALVDNGLAEYSADFNERFSGITREDVLGEIAASNALFSLRRAEVLLSPAAGECLEELAHASLALTRQRFGNTISLYVPLYLSNYCSNRCLYCAFNASHELERCRLSVEQAVEEAEHIAAEGFSDILLVSGEDPAHVSVDYLCELARRLRKSFSTVSVEVYPLKKEGYRRLFEAGVDGVTLYQETYDSQLYKEFHLAGPKADYAARLDSVEAAASAGMRQIGIGALQGLGDWRYEVLCMALHAQVLMKNFWQTRISLSFPRIRPAEKVVPEWLRDVTDKDLTQMITALRLLFPDAGLVLSTREPSELRDALLPLGISRVSAGSKTNPGGYGEDDEGGSEQFSIADERTPAEVARSIAAQGFDPVWKDWDVSFLK